MKPASTIIASLFLLVLPAALSAIEQKLTSDSGYFTLDWAEPGVEVQTETRQVHDVTRAEKPVKVYEGKNTSLFISGKRNGTYRYLLTDMNQNQVTKFEVSVKHHSKSFTYGLFFTGLAVFILTLSTLLIFSRSEAHHR